METLEPLPSMARGLDPSIPWQRPAIQRTPAGSPPQPTRQQAEAADRQAVPPGPDRSAARRGLPLTASYHFDEPANSAVVVLVRPETNQVVRQIPPEKILRLIADLRQMVARVFDRRA